MKIGILTYYKVLNYGAVLQAYALQKVLQSLGHNAFLINYQPKELTKEYKSVKITKLRYVSYWLKLCRRLFLFSPFNRFVKNYLNEGTLYTSLEQLFNDPPTADAYIVGSDQVWRTELSGNNDTFFLPFSTNDMLKIAYAASCGGDHSFLKDKNKVRLLQNFNAISVREEALRGELQKKGTGAETVLDPTLLWNDYSEFIRENTEGDYIVVYNVLLTRNFKNKLKYLRKSTKMPIINIGPDYLLGADKNLLGVNPSEWINLLYHAKYVYTNSFHGVVFSVNFAKKFLYVPNDIASDSRVTDFLSQIGLQSMIINKTEDIDRCVSINKTLVANENLAEMKEKSLQFLIKALK